MKKTHDNTRVALITGSSKGIGAAIAMRLSAAGYLSYVTYKSDRAAGERVVADIESRGGRARLVQLDVRQPESVEAVMEEIAREEGKIHVLVNNAVQEIARNLEEASYEDWRVVTETKIDGSFLCTKLALPLMKGAERASVVFITSYDGVQPVPDYIAYCVGTAGIIAFAKAMALFLPRFGIRVNCVSPGATRTPLWTGLGMDDDETWEKFGKDNPMGRVSTPADVAETVALLTEDPTNYLNGNHIFVDGGNHLRQA